MLGYVGFVWCKEEGGGGGEEKTEALTWMYMPNLRPSKGWDTYCLMPKGGSSATLPQKVVFGCTYMARCLHLCMHFAVLLTPRHVVYTTGIHAFYLHCDGAHAGSISATGACASYLYCHCGVPHNCLVR